MQHALGLRWAVVCAGLFWARVGLCQTAPIEELPAPARVPARPDSAVPPPGAAPAPAQPAWVAERAALLDMPLARAEVGSRGWKGLAYFGIGVSGLMAAGAVEAGPEHRSSRIVLLTGAGVLLGSDLAALLGPEEESVHLQVAGFDAAQGALWTTLGIEDGAPKFSGVALGAGYGATAALGLLDSFVSTRTPHDVLDRDQALTAAPASRAALSAEDIARLERDLYGSRGVVPRWLVNLPAFAGSVIAMAPALDASLDKRTRNAALTTGAIGFFGSAMPFALSWFDPVGQYRFSLGSARTRVSVQAAPGLAFISWQGRF